METALTTDGCEVAASGNASCSHWERCVLADEDKRTVGAEADPWHDAECECIGRVAQSGKVDDCDELEDSEPTMAGVA